MNTFEPLSTPLIIRPITFYIPKFIKSTGNMFLQCLWSALFFVSWFIPPFYGLVTFALLFWGFWTLFKKKPNWTLWGLNEWQMGLLSAFIFNWIFLVFVYWMIFNVYFATI